MLSHVTFTGWDRHTDLDELGEFCGDHEQGRVEIAVLYSAKQDDADRYPEVEQAVEILRVAKASGQRSAVHICGRAAREMLASARYDDGAKRVEVWAPALLALADRVQINVAEDFWSDPGPDRYRAAFIASEALQRPVIIQSRDISGWPDAEHFGPGASRMVPFLFDRSAGTGERSLVWPAPVPGRIVGYAGGIGPDNASELCSWLAETAGARWWLDMETRIRQPFDNAERRPDEPPTPTYVSVSKCRQVMSAVERWFG